MCVEALGVVDLWVKEREASSHRHLPIFPLPSRHPHVHPGQGTALSDLPSFASHCVPDPVPPPSSLSLQELRLLDPSQLAVIVETNYQLVAYTSSSLHVEMLRIFTDVRCRLPNVVIGFITRASVRRAMASGITAATILSFLKTHTHVAVRAGKGRLLPENVEAQIELWHQERSRVKFEEVMMIDLSSLMVEEFEEVRTYAENLAVVCWASQRRGGRAGEAEEEEEERGMGEIRGPEGGRRKRKQLLAVRPEGLERIRAFVEDRGYTQH